MAPVVTIWGPHVYACACALVCIHTQLFFHMGSEDQILVFVFTRKTSSSLIELWPQPHLGPLMISFPGGETAAPRPLPGLQLPLSSVPHPPSMEPSGVKKDLLLHTVGLSPQSPCRVPEAGSTSSLSTAASPETWPGRDA